MIGAWIDCKIRLDDYIPDGYKDLTDTVFVEERIQLVFFLLNKKDRIK